MDETASERLPARLQFLAGAFILSTQATLHLLNTSAFIVTPAQLELRRMLQDERAAFGIQVCNGFAIPNLLCQSFVSFYLDQQVNLGRLMDLARQDCTEQRLKFEESKSSSGLQLEEKHSS